jgi:hypothetical protein
VSATLYPHSRVLQSPSPQNWLYVPSRLTLITRSSVSPVSRSVDILWSSQRAAIPYRWSAISLNRYGGVRLGYQRGASRLRAKETTPAWLHPLLGSHGRMKEYLTARRHLDLLERNQARWPARRGLVAPVYQEYSPFRASTEKLSSQRSTLMEA